MMHPRGVKHLQFPKKYILFESEQIDRFRIIKWLQILIPSDNNEFLFDLDLDFDERAKHVKARDLSKTETLFTYPSHDWIRSCGPFREQP